MWFSFLKGEKKRPCQRGLARSYNKLDRSDQSWPEPDPATSSTQQLPKSNKLQIKINLRSKNHKKKTKKKKQQHEHENGTVYVEQLLSLLLEPFSETVNRLNGRRVSLFQLRDRRRHVLSINRTYKEKKKKSR